MVQWNTLKDLGVLADGSYFEKQLSASGTGTIYYHVISGQLPPGVQLTETGKLVGVPSVMYSTGSELNAVTKFTVRASNTTGQLADRTFSILVSGVQAPTIISVTSNLGIHYDGEYFRYQLEAKDDHPGSALTWKLVRGRLPTGITLNSKGLIEGFIYQNKLSDSEFQKVGWDKLSWDKFMFDFIRQQHDTDYEFTVELSDGINYSRQNYVIRVIAKDLLTADRTLRTVDETEISIDHTPLHVPFITTMPQVLPEIRPELARQDTHFAFKFDAVDFDNEEIYYEITSLDNRGYDQDGDIETHSYGTGFDMDEFDSSDYPMPMYLGLNNQTGWYTGHIAQQVEHRQDYEFQVYARKAYDRTLAGYKSNFIVSILGQVDENITWVTGPSLGSINNGAICILRVEAAHSTGRELEYYIKADGGKTPQGVKLAKSGMLSGRASFEFFQIDSGITTIDHGKTPLDKIYTFTVVAQTPDRSAYSERTFTLTLNCINTKPFENLYLKAFPNADQRRLFKSIMDRQDLFPDQLIYRLEDPYYGKAKDMRFLFLAGIETSSIAQYIEAMSRNHYTKTVLFGNVKTAVALDDNYNIQYEVVYLDVIDDMEGKDPVTGLPAAPAQTISIAGNKNKYIVNGEEITEITPNALGNMSKRMQDTLGVANPNTLPAWMTCPQPDPERPGKFFTPLGYTRAVILAYTVPGASKLIAYRLKNANFTFNHIPFKTDRYQLDNFLSQNYDLDLEKFIPGTETTIDRVPAAAERYRNKGTVDYAINVHFNEVDGQTVNYIVSNGTLDGATEVRDGDLVIFYQQDQFPANIPGYFDHIFDGVNNERSAVYRITINAGVVTLVLERLTQPGDIVTILKGVTYAGRTVNFEAYALHGFTPRWWTFSKDLISTLGTSDYLVKPHSETTFDQRGTRFFSYRDQYADLDSTAKYIKFPNIGVFS